MNACACGCGVPVQGSFARGHNRRGITDLTRYVVEDRGYKTPCWIWTGPYNRQGYGRVQFNSRHTGAYRASYEREHGAIPRGAQIDHLCRVKACINPAHLEAVTMQENLRRQYAARTHCKHGHALVGDNLRVNAKGHRNCVSCLRTNWRRAWHRRSGVAA